MSFPASAAGTKGEYLLAEGLTYLKDCIRSIVLTHGLKKKLGLKDQLQS